MSKAELLQRLKGWYASHKPADRTSAVLIALIVVQVGVLSSSSLSGNLLHEKTWKKDVERQRKETNLINGVAERLERRLKKKYKKKTFTEKQLRRAVQERQVLLKRRTTIQVVQPDGTKQDHYIHLYYNPLWIKGTFHDGEPGFTLNDKVIDAWLEENISKDIEPPVHANLNKVLEPERIVRVDIDGLSKTVEDTIVRVQTDALAKDGDVFLAEESREAIKNALFGANKTAQIAITRETGRVENKTKQDLGDLTLLASGRSNFHGSTWGRVQNVRKALKEHVNNILVAPGETFSFNDTLGGPVTLSRGWSMGKIIVDGSRLQAAAGGGICQASTTVYRAILNAGFKAEKRKAHSLYVSYYEQHGVGIDATIFPGYQDLTFINDTENHLLIQAYYDGFDAVVNIYGTDDGRTVELAGPYFKQNQPKSLAVSDNPVQSDEVAWIQKIKYKDKKRHYEVIRSHYFELPEYIVKKYTNTKKKNKGKQKKMHASAP